MRRIMPRNWAASYSWRITKFVSRRSRTTFWTSWAARKRSPRNNLEEIMANATGRVVQILGGVVDVEFPADQIPELFEAIEVERPGKEPLVLEVQKHIGDNWVRTVAMDATDGLQRGIPAEATGAPIMVPVGPATLGRIFNVLGRPVDQRGEVIAETYYPIHRSAPPFSEQSTHVEVFETGVKGIDLIAPFTKGGKTGIFGGAGTGKTVIIMEL